jgi:hypothetical protein
MITAQQICDAAEIGTRPPNKADDIIRALADAYVEGGIEAAKQKFVEYDHQPLLVVVVSAGRFRQALVRLGVQI